MGLLSGLIGGFAQGGLELADSTLKAQQRKADQEYENELLMKRQIAFEKLREQFERAKEQAKRTQDITDAKTVQGAADDKRVERAQGLINADTGIQHTPEEVKKIISDPDWVNNYGAKHQTETGAPTEWKDGGLINQRTGLVPSTDRTPYQEQMDLSNAAGGIGRLDMQDKYRATADTARRFESDENRFASAERRADLQEKTQADHFAWQKSQAGIANRRADLSEQRAERTLNFMELKDDRADDEGKRRSAATALKDLEEKSKEIKRGIDTGMLNPEALKIDQAELKALDTERARYRNLLGNMSGLPAAPDAQKQSQIDTLFPKKNDGKKEGAKDGGKPVVQRDPNIPQFSTFDKVTVASAAEIADAQRKADDAKQAMDRSRNSQTINAYNQAATQLAAIAKRGR